jgi:16S rRNA (guanine527-N7)-methyltransferase
MLDKWNRRINLVGRRTMPEVWQRHIADSLQLLPLASAQVRRWADLGSGAGFPGVVIAIVAAEQRPGLQVSLIESDVRKAAFLVAALRETGVQATVIAERAESVPPQLADVVSARALAPLAALIPLVARHLGPDGVALLPKGAGVEAELAEALASWRFEVQKHPSATDPRGVVLEARGFIRD